MVRQWHDLDTMLTVKEAADALRVTPRTVYRMIDDGRLDSTKIGPGAVRIPKDSVLTLVGVTPATVEYRTVLREVKSRIDAGDNGSVRIDDDLRRKINAVLNG